MHDWRRWALRIVAAILLGLLAWHVSRAPAEPFTTIDGEAFATHYRITYASGPSPSQVKQAVEAELERIDAMASTWRDDSELMRFNRSEDQSGFDLSVELSWLIEQAVIIAADTSGAFNPRLDGRAVDLSGIAKGYAVDQVVELLQDEFGITDCVVDIGGEVRAMGNGPKGDGWRVGLYSSSESIRTETPMLQLRDTSVATSGAYFKGDHIIDPATGDPVDNNLHSASVIHPSSMTADALATAMYVMGPDDGMQWAKQNDTHVIFLLKDGTRLEHVPN